jgi:hypothetical protein
MEESGPCISMGVGLDGRAAALGGLEAGDGMLYTRR